MWEFFEIAKSDFTKTFEGAWIFPLLILCILWILWQEKNWVVKILTGILPLLFLALYWCPISGLVFIKALGEDTYWRILWLLPMAVTIPYAFCLLLKKLKGAARYGAFAALMALMVCCGKKVLSEEWFEVSTNAYKLPQYVIEVGEVLPSNVHALVSNRLLPYIRQYDPTITLPYGRNALAFTGQEEAEDNQQALYLEVQKDEIDVEKLASLAKEEACTFLVLPKNRTFNGDWEDYGYEAYGETSEFVIFVDSNYEEGQDTRRWLEFEY